jgi:hypothetical protein
MLCVVIGLAGLAEAAMASATMMNWLCLFVIGVLVFGAFVSRSRKLAGIALGVAAVGVLLFMPWPWDVFVEITSNDPDAIRWHGVARRVTSAWLVVIPLVIGMVPLVHYLARKDEEWMDQREN